MISGSRGGGLAGVKIFRLLLRDALWGNRADTIDRRRLFSSNFTRQRYSVNFDRSLMVLLIKSDRVIQNVASPSCAENWPM